MKNHFIKLSGSLFRRKLNEKQHKLKIMNKIEMFLMFNKMEDNNERRDAN